MAQGFLAGSFWGTLCGAALLASASYTVAPRSLSFPQPDASPVEVPGGSEFDQARPDSEPVVPSQVPNGRGDEITRGVIAPEDATETPPAFDTSSIAAPDPTLALPGALGALPELQEDAQIDITGPGQGLAVPGSRPALPVPENPGATPALETEVETFLNTPEIETETPAARASDDIAPSVSDAVAVPAPPGENAALIEPEAPAAPALDAEENIAALSAPDAGDPSPAISGELEVTPEAPIAPAFGASPDLATEIGTPSLPQITDGPALIAEVEDTPTPEASQPVVVDTAPTAPGAGPRVRVLDPVDEIGDLADQITTDRLPRIGVAPSDEDAPQDLPDVSVPQLRTDGALNAHRMGFENPEEKPLISIILVQSGEKALDANVLANVPPSVAFAVDARAAEAAQVAAAYRAAGREVVLIPNVPEEARPQDVEVALRANFQAVPEAVAIMDASGRGFQSNRSAVAQVVDIVGSTGHGLITFPRGLNTAHQRAEQEGVPAGLIFRNFDGDGQNIDQIKRAFDRAAFRARQDTAIILVGSTQSMTLSAIREWSLGSRAATIALAPVSAALSMPD